MLKPEVRKVADEFYKRYEDKMKRPPAGHAAAGFSAIWALFTEVLPKAKTFEPDELRDIALKLDLPGRFAGQWQRHQVHELRLAGRSEGCRTESARRRSAFGSGRKGGNEQVFPSKLATHAAGHGAAAGVERR